MLDYSQLYVIFTNHFGIFSVIPQYSCIIKNGKGKKDLLHNRQLQN